MSLSINLGFNGQHVGLIVRGKLSAAHEPALSAQHADCILSNGAPMGFFGEGGGQGSSTQNAPSGSSVAASVISEASFGLRGEVYDFKEFKEKRPFYVEKEMAAKFGTISAVMRLPVSTQEAKLFDAYWHGLDEKPRNFYLAGGNCSTRAAQAFRTAGLTKRGIPGIDTPNNLWNQLVASQGAKVETYFGIVSFQAHGKGFRVIVQMKENV